MKALTALAKVQKRDTDAARTWLAACLAEEKQYEAKIAALKKQMEENRALVTTMREDVAQDPALWNGYRHWLPLAQDELEKLGEALQQAERESEHARAVVMARVREEEGTKTVLHRQQQAQLQEAERQEQAVIDEQAQYRVIVRWDI